MSSLTSPTSRSRLRMALKYRYARCVPLLLAICLTPFGCTRPPDKQPDSAPSSDNHETPPVSNSLSNPSLSLAQSKVRNSPTDTAPRLALANEYFSAGETFAGIEQMEVVRALGDTDSNLLRDLAQRYDAAGEPEMAVQTLQTAPGRPELALSLAAIYLKLGDFQRSAEALRPLNAHREALPVETQQTIVRAALLAGDAEAVTSLPTQTNAEWQAMAGLRALVAGNPNAAAAALQRALALSPQDPWNGYLLGRAWVTVGDNKRAMAAWNTVLQSQDPPPQAVIGAAGLLARAGHLDEADRLMDRIRGDDRKLPAYWTTVALIAGKRKQNAIAQIALGYAAYNAGDPWRAETIWQGALAQASDDLARQTYAALSNTATRRGDEQAALRYAAAAAKRWPEDPAVLHQYGETLLAQNQLPEALAAATRFQAVAPPERQAQAAELLSRIALDSNNADLLQKSVQRDRELAPTDPIPLLRLAEWQGQQGHDTANLERTLALYQEARRLDPANAEATARAGLILADLKRNDEAIQTLLQALTLNPRVLDGAPNALLTQLYQKQGKTQESRFEAQQYQRIRALKETWPTLLKTLRQEQPAPGSEDWKALGEMALRRHENWIALCAFTRRVRLSAADPVAWRELAAAQKRFGWFDEALASMRRAHLLSASAGKRAEK